MTSDGGVPRTPHVTLKGHRGPIHVARYAKGAAKYALTAGQDRTVRLWNAGTGAEIKTYAAHGYEVLGLAVAHAFHQEGFAVRGTVRSLARANYAKSAFVQFADRFHVVEVQDIARPGAFDDAVKGE